MSFSLDLKEFVEKAKGNAEQVVKKVSIDLLAAVVDRSPVGNPELWASNAVAVQYNNEVSRLNAAIRANTENLATNGRVKPGRLIKDGMDLSTGKNYVGGRFRGNWQVSFETAKEGTLEQIDPSGSLSKRQGTATIQTFSLGVGSIWLINNLPYGHRLEYEGWSTQAPAGMVRISVTEFQAFVNRAITELPE
ncbi:hypothetical protein [Pseudomonas mediterranea]|uniref:HK97 gp10 family phage protein n=1 Tax=Pseudomonas mediterranea TaxID=183795 RepID=A0AAX2DEB0_9PSED|nr:hypothetical protein [Pseudomonas mediterranea]KGU87202.1 hypothetical protein N005_01210 [Pseudomonas mediterranea CFBP 5447]SDU61581.1 hypothetical protein SAMN05216476_3664 [Pseudomonas mediterranea]